MEKLNENRYAEDVERPYIDGEAEHNLLPYLSLEELNENEIKDILEFADNSITALEYGALPNDTFDNNTRIDGILANLSGEENGKITPKVEQARKLFCAKLLDAMQDSGNPYLKYEIYDGFFGMSEDIISYCGGLRGSLELLTIAERTPENPCTEELYDDVVYEASFSDLNVFSEVLNESSPIQQLRLLPIYNKTALLCDTEGYSSRALNKVTIALDELQTNKKTKPLVRLLAESVEKNITDWFDDRWVDIDLTNPEHIELVERDEKRKEIFQKKQEEMHSQFPALPNSQRIAMIAPGVAGALSGNGLVRMISDEKGQTASLLNYSEQNPFGIERDAAFLLSAAHNPGVKELIEEETGLDLEQVPLDAQVQLLKFMTEADNGRFNKLCNTLYGLNNHLKLELAENFLAADFGEDFGDSLLTVANSTRLDNKEKARIFDNISSCRESIKSITGLYEHLGLNDDGEFAKEYVRAANERITDVVTVFAEIARRGYAEADLDWAGKQRFNYDSALEALNYERKSLEIISGTFNDVADGKDGAYAKIVLHKDEEFQRLRRTVYDLYSPDHGHVLFYTRADGSHSFDPDVEYGKVGSKYNYNSRNTGVEASLSMIADPVDPFSVISPYKPDKRALHNPHFYDDATMNKVSAIRLDREGRSPEWAADDSRRDPVNRVGTISVDLAAIGDRADTPSGKIARLLATGNAIRAANMGGLASLNHNTNWFNQDKYGTSDGFKEIVDKFDQAMLQLVEVRQPRARMQKLGNVASKANTGDNSAA